MIRSRRGAALLAAIALMALSAALLAMAFASATASGRAARSVRAGIVADAEARRAMAECLAAWGPAMDSMAFGSWRPVSVPPLPATSASVATKAGVRRLGPWTWMIAADVAVADGRIGGARRRLRLLLGRSLAPDSATRASRPAILRQWALSDGW